MPPSVAASNVSSQAASKNRGGRPRKRLLDLSKRGQRRRMREGVVNQYEEEVDPPTIDDSPSSFNEKLKWLIKNDRTTRGIVVEGILEDRVLHEKVLGSLGDFTFDFAHGFATPVCLALLFKDTTLMSDRGK